MATGRTRYRPARATAAAEIRPRTRPPAGRCVADPNLFRRSWHVDVELKRRQKRRDLLAVRFQPGRQHEVAPQLEQRFVNGEAGRVRRDLEQHTAWLAEVDGLEVLAIQNLGDGDTSGHEFGLPDLHGREVGGPEGDVVDRSSSLPAAITDTGEHVNQGAGAAASHAEARPVSFLPGEAHAEQ